MSMFGGTAVPSLADIAAVTRNNDGGNNGFGDGNGWWVLIILFAIFGGWGNNGYGAGNGGTNGGGTIVYDTGAGMQRGFDTSQIITKLDGINSGICSLGYDQLAQMNGINTNIMQSAFGIQQAINADSVANMQNANAISRQLADCCCENRAAIAQVRYDMATDTCALKTEVHQTGDSIIQNQNAGFNMLNQTIQNGFTNLAMGQKDQQIAELTAKLNACDRDKALANQSTYLLNALNPSPHPAYVVQNPNCCGPVPVTIQTSGCGCNGYNTCNA